MREEVLYAVCLSSVFSINALPSHIATLSGLGEILTMLGPTSIVMYDVTIVVGALIILAYNYSFQLSGIVSFVIGFVFLVFCMLEFQHGVVLLPVTYTTIVFTFATSLIIGSATSMFYYSSSCVWQRLIKLKNGEVH